MNVQCSLIWEPMLYKFKVGHDVMEATHNICCVKGQDAFDRSTVTRWCKKFCSGYKTLNNQSSMSNSVASKIILQTTDTNPASSTQRVSGKLCISQSDEVHHLYDLSKTIRNWWILLYVTKKKLNFSLTLIYKYIYISSSSCRATSTDIPDPLSPLFPIIHCLWQVFWATFRILT